MVRLASSVHCHPPRPRIWGRHGDPPSFQRTGHPNGVGGWRGGGAMWRSCKVQEGKGGGMSEHVLPCVKRKQDAPYKMGPPPPPQVFMKNIFKNIFMISPPWFISDLKGHGNEADFLGFLQKLVPHESLTLPFGSFRFWPLCRWLQLAQLAKGKKSRL